MPADGYAKSLAAFGVVGVFGRTLPHQGKLVNYLAEWLACQREGAK